MNIVSNAMAGLELSCPNNLQKNVLDHGVSVDALFLDISSNSAGHHFPIKGLYVESIKWEIIFYSNLISQLAGTKTKTF